MRLFDRFCFVIEIIQQIAHIVWQQNVCCDTLGGNLVVMSSLMNSPGLRIHQLLLCFHTIYELTHTNVICRDANLWRSKIWRLSLLHYRPPPPSPNIEDQTTPLPIFDKH